MNNLIKINDDLVIVDEVHVHFKNFLVGSYDSDISMCKIYLWDTYVMTIDEAMYISRDPKVMKEQLDFVKDLIESELDNKMEIIKRDDDFIIQFPFVTSTISKTSNDAYNILTEVVDAPNTFEYYSKQEKDFEKAMGIAKKDMYALSNKVTTNKNTEVWEQLKK